MKLYKVHLEYETVIRAESPEAAERKAQYAMHHEIDDEPSMVFSNEITKLDDLPPGWNAQCRPWGERDPHDRTIGRILSANDRDHRWTPESEATTTQEGNE
jgi:hypothetical protein